MSEVDPECPECGCDAVAVVDVQTYGSDGYGARVGDVHLARLDGGYGGGWRLFVHGAGTQ